MGYKLSKQQKKVAKELLRAIVEASGGPGALANSMDLTRQLTHYYMQVGYINLSKVYDAAKLLDVSPWCLSYLKLAPVFGEKGPTLVEVIDESPLLESEKKRLLKML